MMRRGVAIVVLVAGCAPLSEIERNDDVIVGERMWVGPPREGEITFSTEERGGGVALTAVRHQLCQRRQVKVLQRTRRIERHSNLGEVIALYVLGSLATGVGIISWLDLPTTVKAYTASETEATIGIIAAFGVGLTSLGVALGSSVRALDTAYPPQRVEAPVGPDQEVACGKSPLAGEELLLAAGPPGDAISLGKTDEQGALAIDRELLRALREAGTLREKGRLSTADGRSLGELDLSFARVSP